MLTLQTKLTTLTLMNVVTHWHGNADLLCMADTVCTPADYVEWLTTYHEDALDERWLPVLSDITTGNVQPRYKSLCIPQSLLTLLANCHNAQCVTLYLTNAYLPG